MIHRVVCEARKRSPPTQVEAALDNYRKQGALRVQNSLAFVPMLSVMMIAVRLRAMQLHRRDPQRWAQAAMWVATASVTVMVLASAAIMCISPGVDLEEVKEEVGEVTSVCGKVCAIVFLCVGHMAAACLYVAMGALITALFVMDPAVAT